MIKFSLHPSQRENASFGPHLVDTPSELIMINEMMDEGLDVHAETFKSPKNENVTVFFTCDSEGHVATVWEHTFEVLSFNVPPRGLAEESAVLQEADKVMTFQGNRWVFTGPGGESDRATATRALYAGYDENDEYAVGE